jgi:DNA-directed RNA polymerase
VEQYQANVLADFRQQLVDQLPEELAAQLPELPEVGDLDLEQVKQSEYFFA